MRRRIAPLLVAALIAQPALAADMEALFFGPPPPGFAQACSGCHGVDARGNREGAKVIPPIGWAALSKATDDRAAYDTAALKVLLGTGMAAGGRRISSLMPRYDLSDDEASQLVALLAPLDDRTRQGVHPDRLDFGIVLPPEGNIRPHHERAARILETILDEANQSGGVFGRRLTLIRFSGLADFRQRAAAEPVLATLLTLDHADHETAKRPLLPAGIPELFPVSAVDGQDDARRVRGLQASPADIARALAERLIALEAGDILIVDDARPISTAASRAAELALRTEGRTARRSLDSGMKMPAAALLVGFPNIPDCMPGVTTVAASIDTLANLDPHLVRDCGWRLVLADPRHQPSPDHANAARLQALTGSGEPLDTDRAAFVAGELVVKAALAAGRGVNRRTIVEALDRLGSQAFGIWPTLDYGRNRVTGTRDVLIEVEEPAAKAQR